MEQIAFAQLIESELNAAIINSDEEAIKRISLLLSEKLKKVEEFEEVKEETKSDIKMLIEVVKQGFEDVNKRFEDLYRYMDKRFEDINKKFEMMFKFMSLGFSVITILIVVFKFIH